MKARPDYQMATSAIRSVHQEAGVKPQLMLKSNKARDDLDPQKRNWLTWFSFFGETYFADDRHTVSWSSTQSYHRSTDDTLAAGIGRIPGGATQHGVMTTIGSGIRTRTSSAEKCFFSFSPSLRTEGIGTGVSRRDVRVHHARDGECKPHLLSHAHFLKHFVASLFSSVSVGV